MNHTDQIGEELRIMSNAVLDELLEENDVIMMDTCFAMRDEVSEFIDSIEVDFYNNKNKKIGSMLYVMEEDKFYSLETIPINLGKNINLDRAYSIKYKINYK